MATRKLCDSGLKYKGKFISMYESLFKGQDLMLENPNFWDEFFLIKPMISHIENEISRMSQETIIQCKKDIHSLISHCIIALNNENAYRIVYSMQILTTVVLSLYRKINHSGKTLNIVDILFGFDHVQEKVALILNHCDIFFKGDYSSNLKGLFIRLFLIVVTGLDDINENILLDYIMNGAIFELLIQLLREAISRNFHGHDVVLILTLLVNYRKYERTNPFVVKLSILDDELALNGYGQVITTSLSVFCRQFIQLLPDVQVSWLTSITSMIGNIFVGDEEAKIQRIRENDSLLLALYEVTHLNRNFVTTLAYTQSDTCSLNNSSNMFPSNQLLLGLQVPENAVQPFNLLAIFFQYCSILFQITRSDMISQNVKLCFLILSCISEDQYANSLMHDANLSFRVQLHKSPLHHRKLNTPSSSQPLAATLLDLIMEFITSHMMKKFPLELYHQCLGILHRILCYQKRCCIRLNYHWINLWTVLISLLKFLVSHESNLAKKVNIFSLATEVIDILNMFVTYGDMFLLSPNTYDELFYEIIRMKHVFTNLNAMGLRYSTADGYEYRDSALKLSNVLLNIRDILNYFPPRISEWLMQENISTPTEKQIMAIIIQNYDSLTLKLQDNLDQFERYSENPIHVEFFKNMVGNIIKTTRILVDTNLPDVEAIVREYQSCT